MNIPTPNPNSSCCAAPASENGSLFSPAVAELVAVGAAVAAHCEPCLRHHVREAERCGVSRADIDRAVAVAARVKQTPHQNILALARRLTEAADQPAGQPKAGGSCCG